MIATMLAFELFIWVFLSYAYDLIPHWMRCALLVFWVVTHSIAYASENKLRDRVNRLEDEVKNLKKGGE